MKYSIESLMSLVDSGKLPVLLDCDIQVILDSINDWPSPVESLDIFVQLLSKSVGNPLTRIKIEKYILGLDPRTNSWEKEALSQLIPLFSHYHNGITLDKILLKIEKELETFYGRTKADY